MSNKKIALIIVLFVIAFLVIVGFVSLFSRLPLIGRFAGGFFVAVLIGFVITAFVTASKRR